MKNRWLILVPSFAFFMVGHGLAIELLLNGDFEIVGGSGPPPGWALDEFPTTGTGTFDAAQQIDFANLPSPAADELGLWLRPFVGGCEAPGRLVNADLSQTVPATPGEGYSFSAWALFEQNYAGAVATLDAMSPLGAVPSPTETYIELAFLDSAGDVISDFTLDLRTAQNPFAFPEQHIFDDIFGGNAPLVAPAGTESVRVGASMVDGVCNADPGQSAFVDTFSLTAASDPSTELLTNSGLDDSAGSIDAFESWTQIETPEGTDSLGPEAFAQNPNTTGQQGVWLKPWAGFDGLAGATDGILSQSVPGIEGGEYTFSAWSNFEPNYSGNVDNLDPLAPNDPGAPSPTETTLELAFLDGNGAEIDTITLDVRADRDLQGGGGWLQHTLQGTAPAGTQFVRVTGAMTEGVFNVDPGQSAFFDDFSLDGPAASVPCDFNGDNICDGVDIDSLVEEIAAGTNDTAFDLTGDDLVNLDDRDEWLALAGAENLPSGNAYLLGDANLDSIVDGLDFIDWNENKFTALAAWTGGDFNADGIVDGLDFIIWNENKFTSADNQVAVPEPSIALFYCGFMAWFSFRRLSLKRRKRRT